MRKYIVFLITGVLFFSLGIAPAFAQVMIDPEYRPSGAPTVNQTSFDSVRLTLTFKIMGVVFEIAGIVAVYFIVNSA